MAPGGSWAPLALAPRVAPESRSYEASETRAAFLLLTRVDPCIKCTRSKLDTGEVAAGFAASKDFLSACGPWLSLPSLAWPCRGLALPCLA